MFRERPRERLHALGSQALSDAELLALLLRTGARGADAVQVSRSLLDRCGGLPASRVEPGQEGQAFTVRLPGPAAQ